MILDPGRISYQWTLRQIGAFMDSRSACRLTLVEVPDGFVLRFQRDPGDVQQTVVHFARQQLVSRDVQQERMRIQLEREADAASLQSSRPRLPSARPGGYQDFLRAVGYELDQTSVYNVALDELAEGMLVTYLFVDPRHNYVPLKKMAFLGALQRETILRDAYARREHGAVPGETGSESRIFQ